MRQGPLSETRAAGSNEFGDVARQGSEGLRLPVSSRGVVAMSDRTVTRAQLSEAVYQEVGLSRNESAQLVESVLKEISEALTRGETVKISSFGSFFVRQKGERIGRNPKTGQEVPIRPRRVLVFRASHVLKNRVNVAAPAGAAAAPAVGATS
jgi:integration host factor subunit alpha